MKTAEHKPNSVILQVEPTFIYLRQADYSDPVLSFEMRHTRCVVGEQPRTLHCLAPNWVFNARRDCSVGGGLLHLLFTLTVYTAVYFLLHFPCTNVCHWHPAFSSGILLYGVRTFLSQVNASECLLRSFQCKFCIMKIQRKKIYSTILIRLKI